MMNVQYGGLWGREYENFGLKIVCGIKWDFKWLHYCTYFYN